MKDLYVQYSDENKEEWLIRLYNKANEEAQIGGGWMEVDPELLAIFLNNIGPFLKKE